MSAHSTLLFFLILFLLVAGIGYKHELVSVKRKLFRKILYPAGMAMYASPENIKEFLSGVSVNVFILRNQKVAIIKMKTDIVQGVYLRF